MNPFSTVPGTDHENSTVFLPTLLVFETKDRSFPAEDTFQATPTVVGNENGTLLLTTTSDAKRLDA
jgi:hypothetical protein